MTAAVEQDPPVTVMVVRRILPGREAEFESAMADVVSAALHYPGHLGATVFRPSHPGGREYRIVFKFDRETNLRRWQQADDTLGWLARVEDCTEGTPQVHEMTGLEAWFTMPATGGPPPRHRMALLTWLALWPLVSLLMSVVAPLLTPLPFLLRTLVLTGLVTLFMTWLVMPRLTRWLAHWIATGRLKS